MRPNALSLLLVLTAAGTAPSCAGAPIAPSTLAGQWTHVRAANEPPGFFRSFTLTVADTTLSGSGTFQGEAGPSGTMSVSGGVTNGRVHLGFVFHQTMPSAAPDYTGSFDGRLSSANDLIGTITIAASPADSEHFARVIPE